MPIPSSACGGQWGVMYAPPLASVWLACLGSFLRNDLALASQMRPKSSLDLGGRGIAIHHQLRSPSLPFLGWFAPIPQLSCLEAVKCVIAVNCKNFIYWLCIKNITKPESKVSGSLFDFQLKSNPDLIFRLNMINFVQSISFDFSPD